MDNKTFAELGLSPKVQAALDAAGYTIPTPIQAQAIPIAVTGQDVLGIAQTGTGKTAAFVLPMITRLETGRARARMPRSLILAPTRELAAQVAQSFEKYGVNTKLTLALLIGGVSFDEQNKKLDRGVDVLIATPGRLLDHFQRGRLMLMGVEILVIDEADRMLDMGFIPDIEKICKLLPPARQTLFFSATMPTEITRLVDTFLKTPARVEAAPPATTAKTITQRFVYCPGSEDWQKRDTLRGLMREQSVRNAIIFCNRKVEVAILHKSLVKHGFNAGALHGDMDQRNRMETLDKFRSGAITFLCASDVAARGLDIPDVSHIFNYDLPREKDDYVHRIGRTGRAGKEGYSASLVTGDDLKVLRDIEKMTDEAVTWLGQGPTEQDFADAGSRRGRGRGRSGSTGGRDSRPMRGGGRSPSRGADAAGERDQARTARPPPRRDEALPAALETSSAPEAEAAGEMRRPRPPMMEDVARDTPRGGGEGRREGSGSRRPPRPVRRPAGTGEQPQFTARQPRERSTQQPRDAMPSLRQEQPRQSEPPQVDSESSERPAARGERAGSKHQGGRPRGERQLEERQPAGRQGGPQQGEREQRRQQAGSPRRAGSRNSGSRDAEVRDAGGREGGGHDSAGQGGSTGGGFADNVPAFLRKPPRPIKAVSE